MAPLRRCARGGPGRRRRAELTGSPRSRRRAAAPTGVVRRPAAARVGDVPRAARRGRAADRGGRRARAARGEDADQEHAVQRLVLAALRWRPEDAPRAALRHYAARYRDLPVWTAMLAPRPRGRRAGRRRRARRSTRSTATASPGSLRTPDGLAACALLAEPVAGLGASGTPSAAAAALPPRRPQRVIDHGWAATGPFARVAGPPRRRGWAAATTRPRTSRAAADLFARLGRAGVGAARARRPAADSGAPGAPSSAR